MMQALREMNRESRILRLIGRRVKASGPVAPGVVLDVFVLPPSAHGTTGYSISVDAAFVLFIEHDDGRVSLVGQNAVMLEPAAEPGK